MSALEELLKEREELKKCPFCGDEHPSVYEHEPKPYFKVACLSCSCTTEYHSSESEAEDHWNHRPREKKLERICRELVGALTKLDKAHFVAITNGGGAWVRHVEPELRNCKQALSKAEQIAGEE